MGFMSAFTQLFTIITRSFHFFPPKKENITKKHNTRKENIPDIPPIIEINSI
jgi:hypothetical protein